MQCLYFFSSFVCGLPLSKYSFTKIQLKHNEYKVDREQNKYALGTVNLWEYIKKNENDRNFLQVFKEIKQMQPSLLEFPDMLDDSFFILFLEPDAGHATSQVFECIGP